MSAFPNVILMTAPMKGGMKGPLWPSPETLSAHLPITYPPHPHNLLGHLQRITRIIEPHPSYQPHKAAFYILVEKCGVLGSSDP